MGWYEAVTDAIGVADQLRNVELKQKMVDVQMECLKLAEDNASLRQELIALREQVKLRQVMQFKDNAYWRDIGEGKMEGPFCPKCLDGNNKPARMSDYSDFHSWMCPVCQCGINKPRSSQSSVMQAQTEADY